MLKHQLKHFFELHLGFSLGLHSFRGGDWPSRSKLGTQTEFWDCMCVCVCVCALWVEQRSTCSVLPYSFFTNRSVSTNIDQTNSHWISVFSPGLSLNMAPCSFAATCTCLYLYKVQMIQKKHIKHTKIDVGQTDLVWSATCFGNDVLSSVTCRNIDYCLWFWTCLAGTCGGVEEIGLPQICVIVHTSLACNRTCNCVFGHSQYDETPVSSNEPTFVAFKTTTICSVTNIIFLVY